MLIGSMLLWTLESLEIANLRHEEADRFCRNESSQLPNLGLILSYFLRFAEDQKKTYRLNEDDWKYSVVQKADKFGVEIRGLNGSEELVKRLRADAPQDGVASGKFDFSGTVFYKCCKGEEMWGLMTIQNLNQSTRRSWSDPQFFSWRYVVDFVPQTSPIRQR